MPSATEPIDFLIITALEEERDAVLAKLPGWRKLDRDGTGAHTYYEARINTKRSDGAVYHIIVTMLSGMGPLKGAIKAGAGIQRWSPEHVLMVGIAGGVSEETTPGDVIVADQVADYTLGKVRNTGAREERWLSYLADANLIDGAKNFASGWEDLVTCSRPEGGMPKRKFGVIASGGDVIDSKKQIAIYRRDWPKLIGVEMEGGGVAAGLHNDIARPRFLMVRGVSDLADVEDNAAMKATWRAYACDVAAAYAIGLLREGPVVRTAKRQPLAEHGPPRGRPATSPSAQNPSVNERRPATSKRFIVPGLIAAVVAVPIITITLAKFVFTTLPLDSPPRLDGGAARTGAGQGGIGDTRPDSASDDHFAHSEPEIDATSSTGGSRSVLGLDRRLYDVYGQLFDSRTHGPISGVEILFVGLPCDDGVALSDKQGLFHLRCWSSPSVTITDPRIRLRLPQGHGQRMLGIERFCEKPVQLLPSGLVTIIEIDRKCRVQFVGAGCEEGEIRCEGPMQIECKGLKFVHKQCPQGFWCQSNVGCVTSNNANNAKLRKCTEGEILRREYAQFKCKNGEFVFATYVCPEGFRLRSDGRCEVRENTLDGGSLVPVDRGEGRR